MSPPFFHVLFIWRDMISMRFSVEFWYAERKIIVLIQSYRGLPKRHFAMWNYHRDYSIQPAQERYAAPPPRRRLQENMIPGLHKGDLAHEILFSNLSQPAQALFAQLARLACGYLIIYLLHARSTTFLTREDLAHYLAQPIELVTHDLQVLQQLDLAQEMQAGEISFYRLKAESAQGHLLDELWRWQTHWDKRIRQMQSMIWGEHSTQWDNSPRP